MGSREPSDKGEGPFYNNPIVQEIVQTFEKLPDPDGDCLTRTAKAAGMGLGAGILYNLAAVPWSPDPVDFFPKGVVKFRDNWRFFRSGFARPMAIMSVVAMSFAGVECLVESMRDPEKESRHWNAAAGGFASGMVMGATQRRLDIMFVTGAGMGIFMGALQYNGMHYISDPHQMAMKAAGKWPLRHMESKELAALKEKYPDYKDL